MTAMPNQHRREIGLNKRYRAEKRFRFYGAAAIFIGLFFLVVLVINVVSQGYSVFQQTELSLDVYLDRKIIDPNNELHANPDLLVTANYPLLVRNALAKKLGIDLADRGSLRDINRFFSQSARVIIRDRVVADPSIIGTTQKFVILASANIDSAFKGQIDLTVPQQNRKVSDQSLAWIKKLAAEHSLYKSFNTGFFLHGASSRPEVAGIGVALIGSLYMMAIVLLLALPIGVATAIYLEEYAKKNLFTDIIEVNINNLAAVPSIIFGLLGLAVFINFFGLPRSSSLAGSLVLTLMTLPTIIIATRSALRAVPPSIRNAALGLGASKTQVVFQHVLPLAAPGVLTGTIIGIAQALGETAPLILIGMVAFVANYPASPLDPSTALPAQVYMWANEPERAFVERTWGAIIVLLIFLVMLNAAAVYLRRRFERRWS